MPRRHNWRSVVLPTPGRKQQDDSIILGVPELIAECHEKGAYGCQETVPIPMGFFLPGAGERQKFKLQDKSCLHLHLGLDAGVRLVLGNATT